MRDRSRKLLEVTEVCGFQNGEIQTRPLYRWEEGKGLVKAGELLHREKWNGRESDYEKAERKESEMEFTRKDYRKYQFTVKEAAKYLLEGAVICAAVDYLFYQSLLVLLFMLPLPVLF